MKQLSVFRGLSLHANTQHATRILRCAPQPETGSAPRLATALLFVNFGDVIHFFRNRRFEPGPAMRRCRQVARPVLYVARAVGQVAQHHAEERVCDGQRAAAPAAGKRPACSGSPNAAAIRSRSYLVPSGMQRGVVCGAATAGQASCA